MRKSRLISNFVAIVLLVALSQKIGFGIFYHNWQHQKNCSTSLPISSPSIVGSNCNCIDDFSMPFTEAKIEINPAPSFCYSIFLSSSIEYLSNFYQCFNALRGPPVLQL
jgi:hypothetical protein